MDTLVKANVFFFITSIAVVVLTILLVICFYYLSQTLKNFRDISNTLKKGVDHASSHLEGLSKKVTESMIFNLFFGKKGTRRSKKQEKK